MIKHFCDDCGKEVEMKMVGDIGVKFQKYNLGFGTIKFPPSIDVHLVGEQYPIVLCWPCFFKIMVQALPHVGVRNYKSLLKKAMGEECT